MRDLFTLDVKSTCAFLVVGLALVAALLFTLLAIAIRTYEGICDPLKVSETVGSDPLEQGEFWKRRIGDYAVATDRNIKQNARVATMPKWSCYCILLAAVVQALIIIAAIGIKVGHP